MFNLTKVTRGMSWRTLELQHTLEVVFALLSIFRSWLGPTLPEHFCRGLSSMLLMLMNVFSTLLFVGGGWMQAVMNVCDIVALPADMIADKIDAEAGSNIVQCCDSVVASIWFLAYTLKTQSLRSMEKRDVLVEQFGNIRAHFVGFQ